MKSKYFESILKLVQRIKKKFLVCLNLQSFSHFCCIFHVTLFKYSYKRQQVVLLQCQALN